MMAQGVAWGRVWRQGLGFADEQIPSREGGSEYVQKSVRRKANIVGENAFAAGGRRSEGGGGVHQGLSEERGQTVMPSGRR